MTYETLYDSLIFFGVVAFIVFFALGLLVASLGTNVQSLRSDVKNNTEEIQQLKHELKQLKRSYDNLPHRFRPHSPLRHH